MSEPGLLQSAPDPAQGESLWEKAPAWRNLIVGASALTLTALALPLILPQSQAVTPAPQTALVQHAAPVALAAPAPLTTPPIVPIAGATASPVHTAAPPAQSRAHSPMSTAPACALRQPTGPFPMGLGTIIGFETQAQSLADIPRREARLGGAIDPAYVNDLRAMVRQDDGRVQGFDVPQGMTAQVGDRVTLQDSYRNQSLPCSYIPILIVADSGPTSPPAQAPQ
jgi:hypothetical protein